MQRRSACSAPSAGLLALVAACAAPPPSAPPALAATVPTPASSALPTGSLDGVYRGRGPGNSRCGGTQSFGNPLRVENGVASIQTNTAGRIEGPVSPDGTLMIEHGRQTLQGKFNGNSFSGLLSFGSCGYALNYTKG